MPLRPGTRARSACLSLCLLGALACPGAVSAQDVTTFERKLLPFRVGPLADVPRSFWDAVKFWREEEERQRALKAEINFGLSGDQAGEKSLYKLNTGISLSRGVFPSEVSVVSKFQLQVRDGQLQEDVTSLQITYDYHTTNDVQYFAFAERFTDSFMSIGQRYEIGFGARYGRQWGRVGDWRTADARLSEVKAGLPALEKALPNIRASLPPGGPAQLGLPDVAASDLASFQSEVDTLKYSMDEHQARLLLGLAASMFSEIESATLEVSTRPSPGSGTDAPIKTKFGLPSTHRYRVSVRPTIRVRPTSEILISVFPYFKLPLGGPTHVTLDDGSRRLDYRRDVLSELSWSIRREQTGLENVEFVVTYNHYFDNVPPTLPAALVRDTLAAGRVFDITTAEKSHEYVALSLRLRW